METVKKRDFLHFPNRYLKEGDFVITNHGRPQFKVSVSPFKSRRKYYVKNCLKE